MYTFTNAYGFIIFKTFCQQKISVGSKILCEIPELASCNIGMFSVNHRMFSIFSSHPDKSIYFHHVSVREHGCIHGTLFIID